MCETVAKFGDQIEHRLDLVDMERRSSSLLACHHPLQYGEIPTLTDLAEPNLLLTDRIAGRDQVADIQDATARFDRQAPRRPGLGLRSEGSAESDEKVTSADDSICCRDRRTLTIHSA